MAQRDLDFSGALTIGERYAAMKKCLFQTKCLRMNLQRLICRVS